LNACFSNFKLSLNGFFVNCKCTKYSSKIIFSIFSWVRIIWSENYGVQRQVSLNVRLENQFYFSRNEFVD
jgi:hypothetical protein